MEVLVFLAMKEMGKTKGRFALIITLITLISYLVFFLVGLSYGLAQANRTGIDRWKADGVVLTSAANKNILSSNIDSSVYEAIEANESAYLNVARTAVYLNGNKSDETTFGVAIFGIDYHGFLAPTLVEGVMPSGRYETVVSESMKKEEGVQLGDTLQISSNNRSFTVVGFTEEAKFSTSPVIYVDLDLASKAFLMFKLSNNDEVVGPTPNMPNRVNAVVVRGEPRVLDSDLRFLKTQEFVESIPGYMAQVLTFGLMIGFLIVISAIVIAIFMYILTMQKRPLFGVMKAQGISSLFIGTSVIFQTLFLTMIALAIGIVLTVITAVSIPVKVPFFMNWGYTALISAFMLICSLLGSLFSVRAIAKVDPLEALE